MSPHGEKTLLLKPQNFVNQSGASVVGAMAFYKVLPNEVLIVVDDIHLPLGHLRLRPNGSAGGHNGLRDIERCIGQGYARLRLGIGQPVHLDTQIDYVLGRFQAEEQAEAQEMVGKAADCVVAWVAEGQGIACRFNGPLHAPESRPATKVLKEPPEPPLSATSDVPLE
jgi:PTH1 family peptidyl-tRNA hydrolase